jgi:EAL and modified HD-GYP domain-containing signal transduction protein
VIYVGTDRLRSWASLLLLGKLNDKPRTLIAKALERAKMCELLAEALGTEEAAQCEFFTAGLFSALDALMDSPLEDVLRDLPLSASLEGALLRQEGTLGAVLRCVLAYEQANWDDVACAGLDSTAILAAYLDSIAWTNKAVQQMAV